MKQLQQAIAEYNRYREPEAKATLVEYSPSEFTVDFSGGFCRTCGYYDWLEDLQVLLMDWYGVSTRMAEITEKPDGATVRYVYVPAPGEG